MKLDCIPLKTKKLLKARVSVQFLAVIVVALLLPYLVGYLSIKMVERSGPNLKKGLEIKQLIRQVNKEAP